MEEEVKNERKPLLIETGIQVNSTRNIRVTTYTQQEYPNFRNDSDGLFAAAEYSFLIERLRRREIGFHHRYFDARSGESHFHFGFSYYSN
jgi:hypothetical protein